MSLDRVWGGFDTTFWEWHEERLQNMHLTSYYRHQFRVFRTQKLDSGLLLAERSSLFISGSHTGTGHCRAFQLVSLFQWRSRGFSLQSFSALCWLICEIRVYFYGTENLIFSFRILNFISKRFTDWSLLLAVVAAHRHHLALWCHFLGELWLPEVWKWNFHRLVNLGKRYASHRMRCQADVGCPRFLSQFGFRAL